MSLVTSFLKGWGKWIVVALIVAGLMWAVDHYRGKADLNASKVETVSAAKDAAEEREKRLISERTVLIDNQKAWADMAKRIDDLARATASARAVEADQLATIAARVATAKEGIKNAPGADDRFDFSDAAYGLVRPQAEAPPRPAGGGGAGAAKPAPGVGGR